MRALAAALAALVTCTAAAQDIELKGFVLGADLSVEAGKAGMRCRPVNALEVCLALGKADGPTATIAGVPAKSALLYGIGGTLGMVEFRFAQSDFATVRDAVREKYPGLRCADSTVQNRMGAAFEQTTCTFETETAVLTLDRRGSDLAQGAITAAAKNFLDASAAARRQRATEGKKDL